MHILKKHILTYTVIFFCSIVLLVCNAFAFDKQNTEEQNYVVEMQDVDTAQSGELEAWDEILKAADFLFEEETKEKTLTPQDLLAERMANGLVKYFTKTKGMAGCGVIYRSQSVIKARAIFFAYTIVLAAEEHSDENYTLNPWGLLGTFLQESGLDPCACGKNPRETAYRLKLLKKPRIGLTHKKEILIEVLKHRKMKRAYSSTGYDLGLGQMLQPHYSKPNDFNLIFSPVYAANQAAKEMMARAHRWKTDRPWEYWKGKKYKKKYAKRIIIKAKKAGALKGDI